MVRNISKFVSLAAALVLFACAGILLISCPHSFKKNIVGVWKDQSSTADLEYYFCFTSDGKFYQAYKTGGVLKFIRRVKYSVSGNKVKLRGTEYKCSITGDIFKIEMKDRWVTFKRVSSPTEEEIKKAVR